MNIIKVLILDDLIEFLDFWFIHLPKIIIRDFFDKVYIFDKNLKLKANLRNITKPLYGDYTLVGYFIAFPYRLIRIFFALILIFVLLIIYSIIGLALLISPIFLIYGAIFSK